MYKVGRNDPCPCGKKKPDGQPLKFKKCHMQNEPLSVPPEVLAHFQNLPQEPFEKGGFLTGRPFITTVFKGSRMRAVGGTLYKRPADETFHMFLLSTLREELTEEWFTKQKLDASPHPISQWYSELEKMFLDPSKQEKVSGVNSIKQTGNIRSLLSLAYDFYSLKHCGATVLPKLINRLKNKEQFQGARYEISIGGLVARAGFQIDWVNDKDKHCEFIGTHKITKDKAAFEAKSHYRGEVFKKGEPTFDPATARIKIFDHIREAFQQRPPDASLVLFDDLNLPITPDKPLSEKLWFKSIQEQLEKYGFFKAEEYKDCGAVFVTNFSWHFHQEIAPDKNEVLDYFTIGQKFSLKRETIDYLVASAQQYGNLPNLLHELQEKDSD